MAFLSFFCGAFCAPTAKVSEGTNRYMHTRNTLEQLLAVYTPTLRAAMHSVTDRQTDRRTDNRMMPIADHTA